MNRAHSIKTIFLINNLIWGIRQKGKASRTATIYLNKIIGKQIKRNRI